MTEIKNPAIHWPTEKLHSACVALAQAHGGDVTEDSPLQDVFCVLEDALSELDSGKQPNNISELDLYRAALRQLVLVDAVVDQGTLEFEGEFHGSGDEGMTEIQTGDESVDKFLEYMIDQHVGFDWYNNDGGGGDITWKPLTDTVIINAYYNEMIQHSEMDGGEF